jgi:plastocyanin
LTRRFITAAVGATLALAACGGSGGSHDHFSTCSPHGTALHISADHLQFDTDCLAAPANETFSIAFDNKDGGVPHDVDILTSMDGDTLFDGRIITGDDTITYHVAALKPGTYHFHCDVHPDTMEGNFIIS